MCNEFAQERAWKAYCEEMQRQTLNIISPDHEPELPSGSIHPSENAAVIRAVPGGVALELLPWGWLPNNRKGRIINLRSEGRRDPPAARGLALVDRFYEFRDDAKPKSKFEFTPATNGPVAFGVLLRQGRFALATCEPGDDVKDIHTRQPVAVTAPSWRRWLTDLDWPVDLAVPSSSGVFRARQVR